MLKAWFSLDIVCRHYVLCTVHYIPSSYKYNISSNFHAFLAGADFSPEWVSIMRTFELNLSGMLNEASWFNSSTVTWVL